MTQLAEKVVAATSPDRRRAEPRALCDREVSMIVPGDAVAGAGGASKARVTDCSEHGLGLLLAQKVEAGQQVLVRLQADAQPVMLVYTVRYCIPVKTDQYRTGARFTGYAATRFRGSLKTVVSDLTGQPLAPASI